MNDQGIPRGIAALIGDETVGEAEVDSRVAALRATRYASVLPGPHTAQGRNLRRWTLQLLVAERIIAREARARGVCSSPVPGDTEVQTPLQLLPALEIGGVGVVLLACSSVARALRDQMASESVVRDDDAADYYRRNLDLFCLPERRWISRLEAERAIPLGSFRASELVGELAEAVFAACEGATTSVVETPQGCWVMRVDRIDPPRVVAYAKARSSILTELSELAATRTFCSWLDLQYHLQVRLGRGFEHPCDPTQPDAVHRH